MKLLAMITQYARAAPGTVALNSRAYDRYKRYSFDFDQKNFKLDFTDGVLIYKSIKGARANPLSPDFMTRNPNVTIWDGVTEAPDETARGDWMKLVATPACSGTRRSSSTSCRDTTRSNASSSRSGTASRCR